MFTQCFPYFISQYDVRIGFMTKQLLPVLKNVTIEFKDHYLQTIGSSLTLRESTNQPYIYYKLVEILAPDSFDLPLQQQLVETIPLDQSDFPLNLNVILWKQSPRHPDQFVSSYGTPTTITVPSLISPTGNIMTTLLITYDKGVITPQPIFG